MLKRGYKSYVMCETANVIKKTIVKVLYTEGKERNDILSVLIGIFFKGIKNG
jgi:hypothetical protein